jgi:hypothetical protein
MGNAFHKYLHISYAFKFYEEDSLARIYSCLSILLFLLSLTNVFIIMSWEHDDRWY